MLVHLVSLEVLFHVSMMFLKTNLKRLEDEMKTNTSGLHEDVISKHRKKMKELIKGRYPKVDKGPKKEFSKLEKYVGHDLLLTAIMSSGKSAKSNLIFSQRIPPPQWETFVVSERQHKRKPPDLNSTFVPVKTKTVSTKTVSTKKQGNSKIGK